VCVCAGCGDGGARAGGDGAQRAGGAGGTDAAGAAGVQRVGIEQHAGAGAGLLAEHAGPVRAERAGAAEPRVRGLCVRAKWLSVWLFQYASSTREVLARVDFGVSPAYVCLLAFALSASARRLAAGSGVEVFALFKYLARAWHMLLVDWLLRTLTHSTGGLQRGLQIALLAMVVVVVDALALESLSLMRDVRGYTVFRIAGELQGLGVLSSDSASALGAALLAFCAHTGLGALQLHSRVTSSAAEVFFVASVNVLVQSATSGQMRMCSFRLPHAKISGPQGGVKRLLFDCERQKSEFFV
jgi:hypothetical protein